MRVIGRVVRGGGEASATYGVPTANLEFENPIDLDPGVYAATSYLEKEAYPSVVCYRPDGKQLIFEVHLLDWSGDLYGKAIEVEIHEVLSEIEPFESETQMKEKIQADLSRARYVFGNHSGDR